MRIFLAGIMQGSHAALELHDQDYRVRLKDLLRLHLPEADVYDPLADHADSLDYDERRGREVFFRHNRLCREVDLVIAYVPQASMGTAIEMWEAHQAGRTVIAISPLAHNWAVRFLSHAVYPDVESFAAALEEGSVRRLLRDAPRH
jgi:hypothetical protein